MLQPPIDPAVLIREVNATNEAVEDQCLRACQAADIAASSAQVAELAETTAHSATLTHRTIQAERPRRRAPLPRQMILALRMLAPPPPLPSHPTSFQTARHQQAWQQYRNMVRHARALLLARQHQEVARWAGAMAASVEAHPVLQRTKTVSISVDLGVAVSALSRRSGLRSI